MISKLHFYNLLATLLFIVNTLASNIDLELKEWKYGFRKDVKNDYDDIEYDYDDIKYDYDDKKYDYKNTKYTTMYDFEDKDTITKDDFIVNETSNDIVNQTVHNNSVLNGVSIGLIVLGIVSMVVIVSVFYKKHKNVEKEDYNEVTVTTGNPIGSEPQVITIEPVQLPPTVYNPENPIFDNQFDQPRISIFDNQVDQPTTQSAE